MPSLAIIIRANVSGRNRQNPVGSETGGMNQDKIEKYLTKALRLSKSTSSNMSSAVQKLFNGKVKATGNYTYNNLAVWHSSSGKMGKNDSFSLFWVQPGDIPKIFAAGEHITAKGCTKYEITYFGPPNGDFKLDSKISI